MAKIEGTKPKGDDKDKQDAPSTGAAAGAQGNSDPGTPAPPETSAPTATVNAGGATNTTADKKSDAPTQADVDAAYEKGYKAGFSDATNDEGGDIQAADDDARADASKRMNMAQLLAVALILPPHLRRAGLGPIVADLDKFVAEHEDTGDAYIVSALVRTIAEVRPDDILNGRYKQDIENAIKVMNGETERPQLDLDPDSQKAAASRLRNIVTPNPDPRPKPAMRPSDNGVPVPLDADASQEQQAASGRLYGGQ